MFPPVMQAFFSELSDVDPSSVVDLKQLYSLIRMTYPLASDEDTIKIFIEKMDKISSEKD